MSRRITKISKKTEPNLVYRLKCIEHKLSRYVGMELPFYIANKRKVPDEEVIEAEAEKNRGKAEALYMGQWVVIRDRVNIYRGQQKTLVS